MKVPTKFVETLSPEEHSSLVENHQTSIAESKSKPNRRADTFAESF